MYHPSKKPRSPFRLILATCGLLSVIVLSLSHLSLTPQDPPDAAAKIPLEQPPSRAEIGHATWTLLHTAAQTLADPPSDTERAAFADLLAALPVIYPCRECARHMAEYMAANPPPLPPASRPQLATAATAATVATTATRRANASTYELRAYLCEFHNAVNRRLGKAVFDCAALDTRWHNPELCGCAVGDEEKKAV
eukprot:TRINITY_DN7855_c0_g2_i2.p1 TRINITY_DN7855_c0_g2~~TRINITY_DN7855_c0_g2_i2.p1  ORF type:complete len:195 (+),score=29.60 TRINITY_DN7855_c0_g2_i2:60-644(+)